MANAELIGDDGATRDRLARAARERVARVEALLEGLDALPDAAARDLATELVEALLDLYGEGLARVVEHVAERDDDGAMAEALAGDEVVSHLLLLHGLHPVPVEVRVTRALDGVRPYLESHGGDVELLGVQEGVVRLRLQGSCDGCPSSAATLKLAIEDAIAEAAPDVERVEAEGAVAPAPPPPAPLLQLEVTPAARRSWTDLGTPGELRDGETSIVRAGAGEVLLLGLGGRRYAYRSTCARCGGSLAGARLDGRELTCAACGARFDVRRAGRGVDGAVGLEPVPLLVGHDGAVKVALGAAG